MREQTRDRLIAVQSWPVWMGRAVQRSVAFWPHRTPDPDSTPAPQTTLLLAAPVQRDGRIAHPSGHALVRSEWPDTKTGLRPLAWLATFLLVKSSCPSAIILRLRKPS
jgi:hypothetical protein